MLSGRVVRCFVCVLTPENDHRAQHVPTRAFDGYRGGRDRSQDAVVSIHVELAVRRSSLAHRDLARELLDGQWLPGLVARREDRGALLERQLVDLVELPPDDRLGRLVE